MRFSIQGLLFLMVMTALLVLLVVEVVTPDTTPAEESMVQEETGDNTNDFNNVQSSLMALWAAVFPEEEFVPGQAANIFRKMEQELLRQQQEGLPQIGLGLEELRQWKERLLGNDKLVDAAVGNTYKQYVVRIQEKFDGASTEQEVGDVYEDEIFALGRAIDQIRESSDRRKDFVLSVLRQKMVKLDSLYLASLRALAEAKSKKEGGA